MSTHYIAVHIVNKIAVVERRSYRSRMPNDGRVSLPSYHRCIK